MAGDSAKKFLKKAYWQRKESLKEISTSVQLCIYRSIKGEFGGSDIFTGAGGQERRTNRSEAEKITACLAVMGMSFLKILQDGEEKLFIHRATVRRFETIDSPTDFHHTNSPT